MPTVLITGANRGIGAALVPAYLEKGYKVVAAVRDPGTMKAQEGVTVVKIDAGSLTDAKEAVEELKSKHGISQLDIVIANAAIGGHSEHLKVLDMGVFETSWKVNVRGPIILYQAVQSLIPSPKGKFVVISSGAGILGQKHKAGGASYGHSKAALNFCICKLHAEEEIPILAIDPGWLQTDMGNAGAISSGMKQAPMKVSETLPGIVKVIDECTKDTTSGYMMKWDGSKCPW